MILRRLSLENYRKYRKVDIEFPLGLIAVVGRNGMGKTSLVEAIAFALYGKTASRDDLRSCISDWCEEGEACRVELEFEVGGSPYRIVRRVRPVQGAQAHQAELFEGTRAEPLSASVTGVEEHIRRVSGMDYLTFTRSVFSKQKEVNALSAAEPRERQAAIRRMVGIEAVSDAVAFIRQDAKEKRLAIELAERTIEALPERQADAAEAQAVLKPAREEAAKARRCAAAAKTHATRARAALKRLGAKRAKDASLQKQEATLTAELNGAIKQRSSLEEDVANHEERKERLTALLPQDKRFGEVKRLKERLDRASGQHDEVVALQSELPGLRTAAEKAAAKVDSLVDARTKMTEASRENRIARTALQAASANLKELQKEHSQAKQRIGGPASQCQRLRKSLAEIRKEGEAGKCPTCLRHLGDSLEEIVKHLQKELADHEGARRKAEADLKATEHAMEEWTRKHQGADARVARTIDALQNAKLRLQELTTTRSKLAESTRLLRQRETRFKKLAAVEYDEARHAAIDREHSNLAAIHDEVEKLRESAGRLPKLRKKLAATRRQVAVATVGVGRAGKAREKIGFDAKEYATAEAASDEAQDALRAADVTCAEAMGQVRQVERDLDNARKAVKGLLRQKQLIKRDEEEARYLSRLEQILKEFRDHLAERFRPELEAFASALLEQVTGGRYPRVVFDEFFNISVEDNGVTYPLNRFSGGEEDLANLCLRLAISQVVSHRHSGSGSSLVVLDEVFASQDAERRESILQALLRLQEIFQQVVLISHMDDIHDRVQNVLRVTESATREGEAEWMNG